MPFALNHHRTTKVTNDKITKLDLHTTTTNSLALFERISYLHLDGFSVVLILSANVELSKISRYAQHVASNILEHEKSFVTTDSQQKQWNCRW